MYGQKYHSTKINVFILNYIMMFTAFETCYAVPNNNLYTRLLENILIYFVSQQVVFFCAFILFPIPYLHLTVKYLFFFHKDCVQSNQKLASSQLIHCVNTALPYKATPKITAQGTLMDCAGPHSITNSEPLNIRPEHFFSIK